MNIFLAIITAILSFAIAGFIDFFFKERLKRKIIADGGTYNDVPIYYEHTWWPPGWHLKITSIWVILQLIAVLWLHAPYETWLSVIIFYTEDIFYYFWTWVWFKTERFLPKELPWLHADISWYKKIVGEKYPLRNFLIVYGITLIIYIIILILI